MIALGILFLLFAQAAETSTAPAVPAATGVYFRQADSNWVRMQPAVTANANARGVQLFVYTGGYTDMGESIACPGAQASLRISVPRPTLYSRAVGSEQDALLVRLTKRKDSRTYKTSFSNVTVENKGGFRKSDIFKLVSQKYPDGSFSISPEKDLPSGEYLLVLGNAVPAYDFGVDPRR
jgi:hypothetical protein